MAAELTPHVDPSSLFRLEDIWADAALMGDDNVTGQQQRDQHGLNIPIPDPSDMTNAAIKNAVSQLSTLVDARMGGIQAVIAEQFRSIDKRLTDRDISFATSNREAKEAVATALGAVIESSKGGNIRFDLLERRVAALELAISGASGKSAGQTGFGSSALQIMGVVTAIFMAGLAYYVASHK